MKTAQKKDLVTQVIVAIREYGISNVLFRNAVAEKLGVNATDMECLRILFHRGIATPSELSQHTGLSSGSTTAMLDRLEKAKLIERSQNPNDRRGTHITIVKETTEKIAPLFLSVRKAQEDLFLDYTDEELKLISNFFERAVQMWDTERKKLQKKMEGGEK